MHETKARIVKHTPKSYKHQDGLTCGEYNIRGILESFNIPYKQLDKPRMRVKIFGFSFISDISAVLQDHGLIAPVRFANKMTKPDQLKTLTGHIDKDEPVLIAIGNGHLSRERFSNLARSFIGHFITIYGYHPHKEIFYVYDPYLYGSYKEEIPVGNEVRTYAELLKDWEGPFYYPFINMNHVYIPVKPTNPLNII